MREKSLSNVTFSDKSFFLNNIFDEILCLLNPNIANIHEVKNLTNVSFLKSDLNPNIATAHEGKKPFKCYGCDNSFFSE